MTDPISAWCARFDLLVWRVGQGEHPLVEELARLSDEAVVLARPASASERRQLLDRLARADQVVTAAQQDVSTRLTELPAQRRAARRYVATPQVRQRRTAGEPR